MIKFLSILAAAATLPACATAQTVTPPHAQPDSLSELRARAPSEEVIYFVMPDRFDNGDPTNDLGGLPDEKLVSGYDPTHKGFFHGGDLAGLTNRLDYLQGLGITAIWFTPIFQNKAVQGPAGNESAGYHGYWITDFTRPDAHFGEPAEFTAFVDAAHARGMKVYMDIITNHTADVIGYVEGEETGYAYRSKADYPTVTRGGPEGERINEGFVEGDSSEANFAKLTRPDWAYTPVVAEAEKSIKTPAWLNDPIYYSNRGNTTFEGENSLWGDFFGLDDLNTQHPVVRQGMIDIYASWIRSHKVDGFRIDTARHVDPGFWQAFVPAMRKVADEEGIPNFTMFGEIFRDDPDPGYIAQYTRREGFPSVLDFAFAQSVLETVGKQGATSILSGTFAGDVLYEGGEDMALTLPTFVGNHDFGRFAYLVKRENPAISQDELLDRVMLAHAMLMTLRGVPTIYYGAEQGFVGDGNDQLARQDMMPSRTAVYNDDDLIGTDATTADANWDRSHPLYMLISELAALKREHGALRMGRQVTRHDEETPGLFAVSRFDPETGEEIWIGFNTTMDAITRNAVIGSNARTLETLAGQCPAAVSVPGSVRITLPPLGFAVCRVSETAK